MTDTGTTAPPSEIKLDARGLDVHWDDTTFRLEAAHLRSHCRCAGCKQLALQGTPVIPGVDIQLANASPVGGYGLQLHFSDGHERGIYPWAYLYELAEASVQHRNHNKNRL